MEKTLAALAVLFLTLALLSGCSEEPTYPVRFVVDSTHPELQAPILEALDAWESAVPDDVSPFLDVSLGSEEYDCSTVWVTVADLPGHHGGRSDCYGLRSGCRRVIYIDPQGVSPEMLMHEIGHQLGLEHNPDPDSTMFRAPQTTNALDSDVQGVIENVGRS